MARKKSTRHKPAALTDEGLWRRWRLDIELIHAQVRDLVIDDHIFRTSMELLATRAGANEGRAGYEWILRTYGRDAVVGIRRMLDRDWRSVSLINVVRHIEQNNRVVTFPRFRRSYISTPQHRDMWTETARHEFQEQTEGGSEFMPKTVARKHRKELERLWRRLERVAHKRIAHFDPRTPLGRTPLWNDLHQSIATLERLTIKYYWILHQGDWSRGLLPSEYAEGGDFYRQLVAFWRGARLTPTSASHLRPRVRGASAT